MGLYASASFDIEGSVATGDGCSRELATEKVEPGFGGENVGYLTVTSP